MAEPYTGSGLGPLQYGLQQKPSEDWSDFPEASKKAAKEDWSDFPKKGDLSVGETALDAVKSGGVGLGKGTLALGGFVGDMSNILAKGSQAATNYIAEKTGLDPGPQAGETMLPTGESLQKNVEGVTGEFYKPKTVYGDYAEKIGEYAPAAALGPGGFVRKAVTQAVMPAVGDETARLLTKDPNLKPYAGAVGGVIGGLGGALLSRPASSMEAIRKQLPDLPKGAIDDARSLMVTAKAKGIDLTWPEALSQVSGKPVLSDTQRILESAQGSRTRMQDFYAERPKQVDQAALNEFNQVAPGTRTPSQIGPQVSEAAQGHIKDVKQDINAASEPYYKQAENVLLTPAEMSHVRAIPNWTEARDAVREGPSAWRVEHLPDNSVGFLNQVKKHFDQAGENTASKFNPKKNREDQSTYEMSASALKQIGEVKSQAYAQALDIQQQARERILDPILQGPIGRLAKKDVTTQRAIDALFPSNPLPNSHNEIHEAVSALAAKNPGAATQLVRAHMESVFNEASKNLQGGSNQFGAAKFANRLVGNIQQRANLQAAVEALPNGKKRWQGIDNFLEVAEATGTRQAKGSLTAFNTQELGAMSGSGLVGEVVKIGLSPGKLLSFMKDKMDGWKLGRNLDDLARILTDPKSAPILDRISRMPKGGKEAAYLAARLILQSENASMQPREARR